MTDREQPVGTIAELGPDERSIVLSFLSLSERKPFDDIAPIDDLALSFALKASLKSSNRSS
jgi:hypothetical protein